MINKEIANNLPEKKNDPPFTGSSLLIPCDIASRAGLLTIKVPRLAAAQVLALQSTCIYSVFHYVDFLVANIHIC